ncbi:MAG: MarR family transcriptional regulator [Rhodobacteraceae bacterium]|nr:MarR family transcriptional regulator [Paracoccaceae bacterium]
MSDDANSVSGIPAAWQTDIPEKLTDRGFSTQVAAAMIEFDNLSFIWNHALIKGALHKQVIAALGLDLDLTQFHCLTAIVRIENAIGRAHASAATIGLLAEELNIDPSRASRITSELVTRGYLKREAAQDDGRKSIVVLTPQADAVFTKFKDVKWENYIEVFSGWDAEDITTFVRLFGRYCRDKQTHK